MYKLIFQYFKCFFPKSFVSYKFWHQTEFIKGIIITDLFTYPLVESDENSLFSSLLFL